MDTDPAANTHRESVSAGEGRILILKVIITFLTTFKPDIGLKLRALFGFRTQSVHQMQH